MSEAPLAPPDAHYSLDQLASLVGLSARTIRYYIAQGLLARPLGEKRGAHYNAQHVQQLLDIRTWSEAGHSLERIRALQQGEPEDPAPRATPPGSVEVWSRMTLANGLELHLEPGRAGLSPEQVRELLQGLSQLYRQVRSPNKK